MGDSEQESINEEFTDFAIRESIQDVYKEPRTNRYDRAQMSEMLPRKGTWVGTPIKGTSLTFLANLLTHFYERKSGIK